MVKILSNAVTWVIVLLLAIIALLLGVLFEWWGGGQATPSPIPTSSATPSPSASPDAPLAFVDRPVTVGPYVPAAQPLTEAVLASAGSGWVAAIDDTSQINTAVDPHTVTPDQKILYLISPAGVRYELANLDGLGLMEPDLVAWDASRDLLLLVEDRHELEVFNMATGAVDWSWSPCTGEGGVLYGEARGGNWLVRGNCEGDGFDGLYSDTGTLVPSGIVGAGPFLTVMDVGDVQVQFEFEGLIDEKFLAFYPNGTSAPLPWTSAGDCYPLGKGHGSTLAMTCLSLSEVGRMSVWELPIDGTPPQQVVTADQLEDFAANNGGFAPSYFWVTDYCSDSALPIIRFSLGDEYRLGALYGGDVQGIGADASYPFRACHAVSGTSALVSGGGGLWWVDLDLGGSVTMIPPMGSGSSIQTVGTDDSTALRLP